MDGSKLSRWVKRILAIGAVLLVLSIALNVFLLREITAPLPTVDKEAILAEIEEGGGVWASIARSIQPRPRWKKSQAWDAYKEFAKTMSGIPPETLECMKIIFEWAILEMKTAQMQALKIKKEQRLTKKRMIKRWIMKRKRNP